MQRKKTGFKILFSTGFLCLSLTIGCTSGLDFLGGDNGSNSNRLGNTSGEVDTANLNAYLSGDVVLEEKLIGDANNYFWYIMAGQKEALKQELCGGDESSVDKDKEGKENSDFKLTQKKDETTTVDTKDKEDKKTETEDSKDKGNDKSDDTSKEKGNTKTDNKKQVICHVPPGNPANAHSIDISVNAVKHHLKNHAGDAIGACPNEPLDGVGKVEICHGTKNNAKFNHTISVSAAAAEAILNEPDENNTLGACSSDFFDDLCSVTPSPTPSSSVTPTPEPSSSATPTPVPTPIPTPTPTPDPCEGTPENLVVNGGFEMPVLTGKDWGFVPELPCWVIDKAGKAELDAPNTWQPFEGKQSLDLNPDQPGGMHHMISTQPGQAYKLNFQLGGNITGNFGVKKVAVFWAEQSLGIFEFDTTGKTKSNMGWKKIEVQIPGAKTTATRTSLRFESLTTGSVGPVLDDVRVVATGAVPTPTPTPPTCTTSQRLVADSSSPSGFKCISKFQGATAQNF